MSTPYGSPPGGPGGYSRPGTGPQPAQLPQLDPRLIAARAAEADARFLAKLAKPEHTRRVVGLVLFSVLVIAGLFLNGSYYLSAVINSKHPALVEKAILRGSLVATLPLAIYLFVPAIIDRYDPEPWWSLAMALLWGAVVATGFAGLINSEVGSVLIYFLGKKYGTVVIVSVIAPICEEFFKGLGVLGAFYFLRREFDGVVDGIVYATFIALGFACVENIQYYTRADFAHALPLTFVLRGIIAPWGHPLYTAMTGIGFGIARETSNRTIRVLAPLIGYTAGVALHSVWNFVPTVLGGSGFLVMIPFWLLFVVLFFGTICVLVVRKGRVIRDNLRDEVLLGNLTQDEVNLICSPIGRLRCTFSWRGSVGKRFIGAGARLALSKWHTARAMRGQKRTISADFIVPMRAEIKRLRAELMARMPAAPAR